MQLIAQRLRILTLVEHTLHDELNQVSFRSDFKLESLCRNHSSRKIIETKKTRKFSDSLLYNKGFILQTIMATKKYIKLHALYAEKIHILMVKSTKDGTPVNLPLWWIDPEDETTYTIDSGSLPLLWKWRLRLPCIESNVITPSYLLRKKRFVVFSSVNTGEVSEVCKNREVRVKGMHHALTSILSVMCVYVQWTRHI